MSKTPRAHRTTSLIALGAASALALSACAASGGTDTNGGDTTTSGEPITIDYLHRLPDGEGMVPVADIVAKWNDEHPDIQVNATKFDGAASDMILKLETDAKAGNAACLAQVGYAEAPQLFTKGLLADVATEANKYKDNFSAGAFGLMTVGDAIVGLPQDTGPLVYYYNEAAYTELGLDVPKTLDDLTADAATAAAAGKFTLAFTPDEAQYWLSAQSAAAGETWFSAANDAWVVNADGDGSQKVAAFWQNLLDNKQTLATERWGDGFTAALTDGSLIGHIGAAWEAGFLLDPLDGSPAEGQWRVAQLPDFGAGAVTGPDGGSGVAVMKDCEHPAEAMEFNNWFNTQIDDLATQGLVVAANGTPATPDKMLRQFGDQDVLSELATATANINADFPYAPGFPTLTAMNQTAAEVAGGSGKVADIFTTAQDTAVTALEDLDLPVAP